MASIIISDLSPAGFDLFSDSESYLMSLTDDELGIQGGGFWATVGAAITSLPSIAVSVAGLLVSGAVAWWIYG